jgi:thiol-disulfide isomerase/thioredoxin
MLTTQLAAIVLAVCAPGDLGAGVNPAAANSTVLLDFQADWCGPCRAMETTVAQLAAAGYPVQRINIDQQRELARQFQIQAIPCFVLVNNGQEVDRIEGPASVSQLQALFSKVRQSQPAARDVQVRGQSPDTAPGSFSSLGGSARPLNRSFGPSAASVTAPTIPATSSASPLNSAPASAASVNTAPLTPAQLLAATVRLTVEDATGLSYGSGTLVDARNGNVLIVTCGHIFRDSQGKGKITVDVFGSNPQSKLAGQLISFDLKRDIGLVSIHPSGAVATIPVAPTGFRVSVGDRVVSVGCDNGANPTVRESKVNSLDKFLGPANLQVAGLPVQGRSGGGLFSTGGFLIGVCNAADPADNEGLFAAVSTIQAQLDQVGLASVYQRKLDDASGGVGVAAAGPSMPAQMPVSDLRAAAGGLARAGSPAAALANATAALRQLSPNERATLSELRQKAQGAEVICIVRSLSDPKAKSEIIVLDRASAAFLNLLADERQNQDARHLTSLEVRRAAASDLADKKAPNGSLRPIKGPTGTTGSPAWQPNWRANP